MPGTTSEAGKDGEAVALDTFPHAMDSPQSWRGESQSDTLRSTASQKSGESVSKSSVDSPSAHVEVGMEAKEKEGRRSSWMKNIGSGMRTLRLRKSTEKANALKMHAIDQQPKEADTPTKEEAADTSGHSPAAPPNVIPPFENEQPTSDVSKEGKSSLRRGWRKRAGAKASSANGAAGGAGVSGAQKSGSGEPDVAVPNKADPSRFIGEGLCFKAKLIGVLEVSGPRGDRICQEALSELKMAVKAAGEHKQKVTVHVALDGLRLRDERSGDCLYHHPVHKISFIAQDLTDSRAFGYIFGAPDTGHRFFGIKTDKSASGVVMAMRDLFQVVFDLKKKEIERAKQQLEMQQKFLATRAAENAPRTDTKGGRLAETYIEGACALPSPARGAPAEADLLNLETELTSLQEGLDNLHSNLIEARNNPHAPFNRGSTSSISSDPHSILKHAQHNSANRASSTTGHLIDPFGDSFDPFDSGSRFVPPDPFSNIDPFPSPRPGLGLLEGVADADPFYSPPTTNHSAFSFPDKHARTSTTSSSSSRYATVNESLNGPPREERTTAREHQPMHWTASFEDNFTPEARQRNGPPEGSGAEPRLSLDIFRELDPLGTGTEKPFVDRKDFFQELKTPAQKQAKELSTTGPVAQQSLHPRVEPLPNSFSTNFNPPPSSTANTIDFGSHFKVPAAKSELKTSSIRLDRGGVSDSPPNYTPPLPPPASSASNSIYFVNPAPPPTLSGPPSRNGSKRSPQLLKRMTISSSSGGAKNSVSPRASGRGRQHTLDSSSNDEIPNITPPPRPPHSGTLNRNASITTAVPRPHSGKSDAGRQGSAEHAPEPPPRPLLTTQPPAGGSMLPLVSPPPLPPKKQPVFNLASLTTARTVNGKPHLGSRSSDGGSGNDLPLPLPSRKNGHESSSIPRYAVPPSFDKEVKPLFPSPLPSRKQLEAQAVAQSTTALSRTKTSLTMEQALSQVATLSLGQLASRLELPVEQLSSLTIQQLAERLTSIDLKDTRTSGFETNFEPEQDDFSTVSAPSTMEGAATRDLKKSPAKASASYDKYAVFRELLAEDASGFSIIATLDSKEGSGSRTLTSRDSSSERTLQADDDNPLATMDDVTDANLSDGEERSMLDEDVGDNYLEASNKLPQWATFDSHFGEQTIPLESAFNKSEDSPSWDSDDNPALSAHPLPAPDVRPKALKTTKIESQASQFDFQPFRRANPRLEDAVEEGQSALDPLVQSGFQRQSSGSSKHSGDRYAERGSDYSGGSTGRENRPASGRKLEVPPDSREVVRQRDSRPSSYSSSGRKYSRGESDDLDDEFHHHRRRQYDTTPTSAHGERRRRRYYERDEGGVENPSFDPTLAAEQDATEPRSRKHPREFEDEPELEEDDDRSYSSRHSNLSPGSSHRHHRRRHHAPKHYSHSLHRRRRDDRFSPRDRKDFSPDRCSNHESDCDSYEEDSRRGRREREYYRDPDYSSRPSSSGSGRRNHSYHKYRGASRDFHHREPRHGHRDHRERRHRDPEDRDDFSDEEEGRFRRHRGRRPHHHPRRDRDDERYYSNSASWESESPPPHEPRGERKRHSAGKGGRPISASLSMTEPFDEQPSDMAPKQRPTPHSEGGKTSRKETEQEGVKGPSEPGSRKMSLEERQMAFDDNFEEPQAERRASEGRGEVGGSEVPGEVFFPSSFDVDMEAGVVVEDEEEAMEVKTPELGAPAPEAKILSMISEESHHSNSNNSAEAGNECGEGGGEVEMKKSDSFNIFERERDPFAEDDFFN